MRWRFDHELATLGHRGDPSNVSPESARKRLNMVLQDGSLTGERNGLGRYSRPPGKHVLGWRCFRDREMSKAGAGSLADGLFAAE